MQFEKETLSYEFAASTPLAFAASPRPPAHAVPTPDMPTPGEPGYIAQEIVQSMTQLRNLLASDVGAMWTLADELAGGVPAMRSIIMGFSVQGAAALATGYAAFQATQWVDEKLDGALHEALWRSVEMVTEMDLGSANEYFGADGFTTNDTPYLTENDQAMMSDICSNWDEIWEDTPVETELVGQPPVLDAWAGLVV